MQSLIKPPFWTHTFYDVGFTLLMMNLAAISHNQTVLRELTCNCKRNSCSKIRSYMVPYY